MISTWHSWAGRVLASCERLGIPWWAVTCVAYLIGFEFTDYFVSRGRSYPWDR